MSPRRAMYHGPTSMMRRPSEDDDRQRQYQPPSPIHGHPYSPSSRSQPQSPPTRYPSRPSTAVTLPPYMSPKLAPPPSPKVNGSQGLPAYNANGPSTTTRYDPLADHRETNGTRRQTHAQAVSPIPTRGTLPPYNSYHPDPKASPTLYPSPTHTRFPHQSPTLASSHAHPNSRHTSISYSPAKPSQISPKLRSGVVQNGEVNGTVDHPSSQGTVDEEAYYNNQEPAEHPKVIPARKSDPMSFSNILSNDVSDTPKSSSRPSGNAKPPKATPNVLNGNAKAPLARKPQAKSASSSPRPNNADPSTSLKSDISSSTQKASAMAKRRSAPSIREAEKVQRAMEDIDAMDLSDVEEDSPEFMAAKTAYLETSKKRLVELERNEGEKHKRRRDVIAKTISRSAGTAVEAGKQQFRYQYEALASQQVQAKEVQDEKERKKDMQRKRRREKTLQTQAQLQQDAHEKALRTTDEAERIKLVREAQKAEKKVKTTKRMIERADAPEGIREVTPLAPNLEGGTMGTFQTSSNMSPEPPRKKARTAAGGGSRPKKSKEKKEAEKAAAEAGYAAGLHTLPSNEPVLIAPKEETPFTVPARPVRETRRSKETAAKDASPAAHIVPDFDSEVYNQIYAQIWKEISKNVNKVVGIKNKSHEAKATNFKKTAVLASKEARRWQSRTNKAAKDVQARAKRSMRDMTTFWKRNERAEREMRKQAEKQELENAKKAEADRESNRQKRKLNFLIEQTELFSHFVGRKVKTAEVERSTDSEEVGVSTEKIQSGEAGALTFTLPDSTSKAGPKVTNFEDLDFDAEDDTVLRAAAEANAQNAVEEAQAKARAFNTDGQELQGQFDDGEMNFQNPTGLGENDISQPKMLAAQLKEYQLKGLNWLVHLYEQGINGILADEMGLGKTVQSISVMGYLAEKHNIWGPFVVIAPSSTLHNWQQEIARFVPDLKCLPYWGNAKDRKVLRKFWDRKHITYNKDSPFHVLITSYQLAVTDAQYIQKIRWQYMILDEAQAIKSSQSTRWKSLLGLRCRNRLLLTGTPIQNNMQELWALLHFIMPTLFDNHEEFSEWFSKDIESHAQSNTKLNEDQLKRLHKILKPFMLRRVKKHVQKELGDKEEKDVYCDLSYRQRLQYATERSRINILDVAQIAAIGDDQDSATLMTLVMEFRKICNHPDLLKRAETTSPLSNVHWGECESFVKEGSFVNVRYSTRNLITYDLPRLLCNLEPRLDLAGSSDTKAGSRRYYLRELLDIWTPERIMQHTDGNASFSWLPFADMTAGDAYRASHRGAAERAIDLVRKNNYLPKLNVIYDKSSDDEYTPTHSLFKVTERNDSHALAELTKGPLHSMFNISRDYFETTLFRSMDRCAGPGAQAPPIEISANSQSPQVEFEDIAFNVPLRQALSAITETEEAALINADVPPNAFPVRNMLPEPLSRKSKYTNIKVPSMQRFVTDSGKLAKLDQLLRELKQGGHRVLLYFQMTRMMDLMEEYLTFRNYRYLRLDGSTKLEDRRDAVADFQTQPEVFIFLLSTRAGGLGINLTAADTVIFYDSDWNPTIDSQAMDRAHRLGQTRQVTVYRMITRGTIEERIRKRALQKEEVQRVVISGGGAAGVDFNARSKENRTKDIALWLADDEQAELIEKKEAEVAAKGEDKKQKKKKAPGKKKEVALEDMYHEGEGDFGGEIDKPSGAATPIDAVESAPASKRKGISKKAKTAKQRLAIADGSGI